MSSGLVAIHSVCHRPTVTFKVSEKRAARAPQCYAKDSLGEKPGSHLDEQQAKEKAETLRRKKQERELKAAEAARKSFFEFWSRLSDSEREAFTREAICQADRTKRDGYTRMKAVGGVIFEQYTQIILQTIFCELVAQWQSRMMRRRGEGHLRISTILW